MTDLAELAPETTSLKRVYSDHLVRGGTGVPIYSWAVEPDEGSIKQALDLSRLPFAAHHVALMPDAHQGYGMPIGGVLFAHKAVVPGAIGVDIGCGVAMIETDATADQFDASSVVWLMGLVAAGVPVGNGPDGQHKTREEVMFQPPDGTHAGSDLLRLLDDHETQLGTMGGGNHFAELQSDETGRVWFMIHSGSRAVGKKTCDRWHKKALELNLRWHSSMSSKELAYLPWDTAEAREYWNDMTVALAWAEENRRRMAARVIEALAKMQVSASVVLDVHHNYAAWESHYGQNGIVHRKGAVRARVTDTVVIPGSMGTASYVAQGLGNRESFETCQHGAGRARSRGATRRATNLAEMEAQLAGAGVVLVTPDRNEVVDESVVAYKDIEAVMAASADLVQIVRRHVPMGVLKG